MSAARQPMLAAGAAVGLAVGLGMVLAVAAGRVEGARVAAATAEARMAAALWEHGREAGEADGGQAVRGLLGARATVGGATGGGAGAGAYGYEAGALEPAVWIAVAPRREGGRGQEDQGQASHGIPFAGRGHPREARVIGAGSS